MLTLLLLLAGCTQDADGATSIHVYALRDPALSLTRVLVRVYAPEADTRVTPPLESVSAEGRTLDTPVVVEKRESTSVLLVMQGFGLDDPGAVLVEHRVRAQFEEHKTLALRVLLTRLCASQFCGGDPARTCYGELRDGVSPGNCGPVPGPYPLDEDRGRLPPPEFPTSASADAGSDDAGALDAQVSWPMDAGHASLDGAVVDAKVCSDQQPDGSLCDPLTSCGCAAGEHCQTYRGELRCQAIPANGVADGRPCADGAECAAGLACSAGTCRPHCRSDSDCVGGPCALDRERGLGLCYRACGGPSDLPCEEGATCSELDRNELPKGLYCMLPRAACGDYVEDGECDEPGFGTGLCAAGTDTHDCCARSKGEGRCDPIAQCGCGNVDACVVVRTEGDRAVFGCIDAGPGGSGSLCELATDCQRGYGCYGGLCKKFCRANAECESSVCLVTATEQGVLLKKVGACVTRCDFETGVPCAAGSVCLRDDSTGVDFCHHQPAKCPSPADDTCDETSRLCAVGTDPDCRR